MTRHAIAINLVAVGCLAVGASAALAAEISRIEPEAASVRIAGGKATVRFNVSGSAERSDNCGYLVDYGDGLAGDSRLIRNEAGRFTRTHERTFTKPGTYTVRAAGRHVKTTPPCSGASSTTVTVETAVPARRARVEAAPACPEGWMLIEGSVNRDTGAFSCSPKPTVQLVCGEGLRYFARDGIIGCRAGRSDRRR